MSLVNVTGSYTKDEPLTLCFQALYLQCLFVAELFRAEETLVGAWAAPLVELRNNQTIMK